MNYYDDIFLHREHEKQKKAFISSFIFKQIKNKKAKSQDNMWLSALFKVTFRD